MKLYEERLIYPISDNSWVTPIKVVPKKGDITVIRNEKNKLISTRTVIGWRVNIYYRRLNQYIRKNNFPLPFMDKC